MVDLVHSRDSKYLRIKVKFLLTKSIFRSVVNLRNLIFNIKIYRKTLDPGQGRLRRRLAYG